MYTMQNLTTSAQHAAREYIESGQNEAEVVLAVALHQVPPAWERVLVAAYETGEMPVRLNR